MRTSLSVMASFCAALTICGCATVPPEVRVRRACETSAVRVASKLTNDPKDDVIAVGAGVVAHKSGYVLTCWHTLATEGPKHVVSCDGKGYRARVVCAEKRMDVALMKIESDETFIPVALGDSAALRVGDAVLAKANVLDDGVVLTQGVVIDVSRGWGYFDFYQSDAIEFDAHIQPGNSGGPVFNDRTELIGIISSKNFDVAEDQSFATPINTVLRTLVAQLYADGRYYFDTGLDVPSFGAATVAGVTDGSPGDKAGIRTGDVVTAVDGQPVSCAFDYHLALIGRSAGDVIPLKLRRGWFSPKATLTLGDIRLRPAEQVEKPAAGIRFERYEGSWEGQPDLDALEPVETGVQGKIDFAPCDGEKSGSLRFSGYVRVPADGIYTFGTTSDSPNRLLIGGKLVVKSDNPDRLAESRGSIPLAAGLHPITVTIIKKDGGKKFVVTYRGPETDKQTIPASALWRAD